MKGCEYMLNVESVKNFVEQTSMNKKKELKKELMIIEEDYEKIMSKFSSLHARKEKVEIQLIGLSNTDSTVEKIYKNILAIQDLPLIENVLLNSSYNYIETRTRKIICKASNGGLYDVGRFYIKLYVDECRVTIQNVDSCYQRRSTWGSYCQHPHVSNSKKPCLGNASESIVILNRSGEYAALFSIIINFLSQANLNDVAGRYVANWDLVDSNGNVIRKGYEHLDEDYFEYNLQDYTKDVMPIVCASCGDYVPKKLAHYHEESGKYSCCYDCYGTIENEYKAEQMKIRKQQEEIKRQQEERRLYEQHQREQQRLKEQRIKDELKAKRLRLG